MPAFTSQTRVGMSHGSARAGYFSVRARHCAEVFHLAQFAILKSCGGVVGASPLRKPSQVSDAYKITLVALAQAAWENYLDNFSGEPADSDILREMGAPDHVEFDAQERVSFAHWSDSDGERQAMWNEGQLQTPDTQESSFELSVPFRPFRLEEFPDQTLLFPIKDRRHLATAALAELFDLWSKDLEQFSRGLSPDQVWRRIIVQVSYYRTQVRESVKALPEDEFSDWYRAFPKGTTLEESIALLANRSGTVRAILNFAVHIATSMFGDLVDNQDQRDDGTDEMAWVLAAKTWLTDISEILKIAREGYSTALLAFSQRTPSKYRVVTVLRPAPANVPMLAAIPTGR